MGIVYLCHEGSCHIFIYNVMLLPTLFGKESVEEKEKNEKNENEKTKELKNKIVSTNKK